MNKTILFTIGGIGALTMACLIIACQPLPRGPQTTPECTCKIIDTFDPEDTKEFTETIKATGFQSPAPSLMIGLNQDSPHYKYDPATRTYTLTADLDTSIIINSSDITLDGAGHKITGSGYGYGIHILTGLNRVQVRNCRVSGFKEGIYCSGSDNTLVNNTLSSNSHTGIYLFQEGHQVISNTCIGNQYGIASTGSGHIVTNNTVISNTYGIESWGTLNYTVSRNRLSRNTYSIYLGHSSGSEVSGNIVRQAGQTGVYFWMSSGNTIRDNRISDGQTGSYLYKSNQNIVLENTSASNKVGLSLVQSAGNLIYHNNIYANTDCNVSSDTAIELSHNQKGNWWGHNSAPGFIPAADSRDDRAMDSYPYLVRDGWSASPEDGK